MCHLLTATFFIALACAVSVTAVSQRWSRDVSNSRGCSKPGQVVCSSDCRKAQVCLGDGEGGYRPEDVQTCAADTKCSQSYGTCVEAGLSDCHVVGASAAFPCSEAGAFPDPYNCSVFHVCLQAGASAYTSVCEEGSAFNPLTSDCSLTTADRVCTEGPIELCRRTGEMGVLVENPAIYYICTVNDEDEFVPQMHKCRGETVFDLDVAECVSPTEPPPEMCGDCPNVQETVADPEDCQSYYTCGANNRWVHDSCLSWSHYDPEAGECTQGICSNK